MYDNGYVFGLITGVYQEEMFENYAGSVIHGVRYVDLLKKCCVGIRLDFTSTDIWIVDWSPREVLQRTDEIPWLQLLHFYRAGHIAKG